MKQTILITDEENLARLSTSELLESQGYETATAASGEECIRLLQEGFRPHLILLDAYLGTGKMDGIETSRTIYGLDYDIPVVFFTAHTDENLLSRLDKIKQYGYVQKYKGNEPSLLAAIKTAFKLHKTERSLKENDSKYHFFFNSIPIAAIVSDADYRIHEWNTGAEELFGYNCNEAKGNILLELIYSNKNAMSTSELKQHLKSNMRDREKSNNINYDRTRDGRDILCEWFDLPYRKDGKDYILSVAKDITQEQELITSLKTAVLQKEYLMKELHHRTKNNLSMISALIDLEINNKRPGISSNSLEELKHKISALSMVYDKLKGKSEVEAVELASYLRELIESLFASIARMPYKLEIELPELYVSPQTAINIGLISNEIATNAVKYGFRSSREDFFRMRGIISEDGSSCELQLENSGAPFPEEIDFFKSTSLGLQLIHTFAQQIDGKIELRKQPSTQYSLIFPIASLDATNSSHR